jgi:hypothetical protein
MASAPIRDQLTDHLITRQNAGLEEGNSATGSRLETVPQTSRSCSPTGC